MAPVAAPGVIDPKIPRSTAVLSNIRRVIMGRDEVIARLLWSVAAQGHVLFRDVPGVSKTDARQGVRGERRLQLQAHSTPDLLPMDVSGSNVFDMRSKTFRSSKPGRSSPTCSWPTGSIARRPRRSLRCSRSWRRQVHRRGRHPQGRTPVRDHRHLANPLEDEGTYALPAAQLDRFMMMLSVGYPPEAEAKISRSTLGTRP